MVAQRMGSQGGGGNCVGETRADRRIQARDGMSGPLARQGSLYSLTLDEVQSQLGDLGKPLSSMNLDELLKTVWTAEVSSNQAMGDVEYGHNGQPATHSGLMLSMDLGKKTVDEVWQDMKQGDKRCSSLDGKVILGEMTLEDFLVKAGVVAEPEPLGLSLQPQWMNCQVPPMYSQQQQQPCTVPVSLSGHPIQQHISYVGNCTVDAACLENQVTTLMGALSDTQTPGRKRVAPGDVAEKSVERRQKRMIKNRESAARSRARKQAYTQELENKISQLEEEIERLKKQKELVKVLPDIPLPKPKYQLRRTSSAPL